MLCVKIEDPSSIVVCNIINLQVVTKFQVNDNVTSNFFLELHDVCEY